MRIKPLRSARLDARITPELQEQLKRVAEIQGRSVSDYVAATLQAAVRKDMAEAEIIQLSREASEQFAAALIDLPPVSPALERAFERRRRLARSG